MSLLLQQVRPNKIITLILSADLDNKIQTQQNTTTAYWNRTDRFMIKTWGLHQKVYTNLQIAQIISDLARSISKKNKKIKN